MQIQWDLPPQLIAGQEAGAEAAIHAMQDIFANEDTEAVLLIDAENAFNSINRKVMLHNLNFICPVIITYHQLLLYYMSKIIYNWWRRNIV